MPAQASAIGTYRQTSSIHSTLVGKEIVDHSNVVRASAVGTSSAVSPFSTWYLTSINWTKITAIREEELLSLNVCCILYWRFDVKCCWKLIGICHLQNKTMYYNWILIQIHHWVATNTNYHRINLWQYACQLELVYAIVEIACLSVDYFVVHFGD